MLRYRIHLEQKQYAATTINLRLAAVRRIGVRVGNWLTTDQGRRLLAGSDRDSLRAKRNYAILAMPIGCGLRRGEWLGLRVESIQLREEYWVIADLLGRAGYVQTIPIPGWGSTRWDQG